VTTGQLDTVRNVVSKRKGEGAQMFGRKPKHPDDGPAKEVELVLVANDGSFNGDNDIEVDVHGFNVRRPDGQYLQRSETGPAMAGVFYFRLAGATFNKGSKRLDGSLLAPVLLRHCPDNPHDSNAIEVIDQHGSELAGYVHAELAPKLLPAMPTFEVRGKSTRGSTGLVVKTFHKQGRVVGAEIVMASEGFEIKFTGE
jgi:hypothetical protein